MFPLLLTEKRRGCYLGPDQRAVKLTLSAPACQAIRACPRSGSSRLNLIFDLFLPIDGQVRQV